MTYSSVTKTLQLRWFLISIIETASRILDRVIFEPKNYTKISFIEPIASFHEIQKITKMSFNIPLKHTE
jgi:hypothetical protein